MPDIYQKSGYLNSPFRLFYLEDLPGREYTYHYQMCIRDRWYTAWSDNPVPVRERSKRSTYPSGVSAASFRL